MPAPAKVRPRQRLTALAAVVLVQGALIVVLASGFRVDVARTRQSVEQLIDITLAKPLPIPPPPPPPPSRPHERHSEAAAKAAPAPPGGSPGPKPAHAIPEPSPVVPVRPSAPAAGGGTGSGQALGAGAGGGTGGNGDSADDGGTDLEKISGEITTRDYPRALREAGVGGHVSFTFTVEPNGRVGRCAITRSSGVPELDALTCRLVQQRFVYRPSTDRFGRPIEDEVDGDYDWIAGGR